MDDYENAFTNDSDDNISFCGPSGYLFRMRSYKQWVFHTGTANTFIIIIFNIMVVRAFSQKRLLSSSTIPLIILAICDMFASVFMFWPHEIGLVFDFFSFDTSKETVVFLHIDKVEYPFCIFSEISYFLGHVFHSSSFFITSLVAIQKAIVIKFPFRSKIYLRRRRISVLAGLFLIFMACGINISLVLYTVYSSSDDKWCCRVQNFVKEWNANEHKGILFVCYTVCFCVLVFSSLYIAFKLTCQRKRQRDTGITRQRHHRSAIIVVVVACFCLITELIPFSCRSSASLKKLCLTDIHEFELLILQFGFAVNFLIYIIMSEKLRSGILFCKKERPDSRTVQTRMINWTTFNDERF